MQGRAADTSASRPSARSRFFVGAIAAVGVLSGAAVRTFVLRATPVPPTSPAVWLAEGILQDVAVFGGTAALFLLAARRVPETAVRAAYAALAAALVFFQYVLGEAIAYFGHPPRREDLEVGWDPRFFLWSLDRATAVRAVAGAALFAGALVVSAVLARRAREVAATPRRLALGAAAAAALAWALGARSPSGTTDDVAVAAARLWRSAPPRRGGALSDVATPVLPPEALRDLAPFPRARSWTSPGRPLAHRTRLRSADAPAPPAGVRPNVLLVLMEGVRAHEVGAREGPLVGLTPNLDRLAAEGVSAERAFSPGTCTPEGELAAWYGLLPMPDEILLSSRPATPLFGLPELLRASGRRSLLWIHNSDQTFYREDRFYRPRGFRTIDGRDFDAGEPGTNWGKSDRALVARTLAALDRLEEPFGAMMLTITNHHPFQVPSDSRGRFLLRETGVGRLADMLQTVHYTDDAVGELVEGVRARAWGARTVVVIASDHGLPLSPLEGAPTPHGFSELRHGVPLVFWSPMLQGGRRIRGPVSLADVPETIAGLLGLEGDRTGPGRDLLDPADDDPDRPVLAWDREARIVSVWTRRWAWHGTRPERAAPGPQRFDVETLVDTDADPAGSRDVSGEHPDVADRLRAAARAWLDVYPWLVTTGRAGP